MINLPCRLVVRLRLCHFQTSTAAGVKMDVTSRVTIAIIASGPNILE